MKTKAEVRNESKRRVNLLTEEEKSKASSEICDQLLQFLKTRSANTIGIYLALPDEVNLSRAYETLLKQGITLALPFPGTDSHWDFHTIDTLKPRTHGEWGLGFPPQVQPIDSNELDLILVPGRAFTPQGDRVGRGKGIYDRLLADTKAMKIGVCFSCQMIKELPTDAHDIRMDRVVRSSRS